MRFEARELKSHAEPTLPSALRVGAVYFSVQFIDEAMVIPEVEPLAFIGWNLVPDDRGMLYFQDADSYRQGIRFGSVETGDAVFYAQGEDEINHIFEYEQALDLLLACSIRRTRGHDGST